jgi:hypothetical protein
MYSTPTINSLYSYDKCVEQTLEASSLPKVLFICLVEASVQVDKFRLG